MAREAPGIDGEEAPGLMNGAAYFFQFSGRNGSVLGHMISQELQGSWESLCLIVEPMHSNFGDFMGGFTCSRVS